MITQLDTVPAVTASTLAQLKASAVAVRPSRGLSASGTPAAVRAFFASVAGVA